MNNHTTSFNGVKNYFAFENFPPELTALRRWVLWNSKKMPLTPSKSPASSTDPQTWQTFNACKQAFDGQILWKTFKGLGFVFSKNDGYVGIDIDDAFPLSAPVQELVQKFASYTEISQSGNGLHIIIKGKKPRPESNFEYKGVRIEVYENARYFALTGNIFLQGMEIQPRQDVLEEVYAAAFPTQTEPKALKHQNRSRLIAGDDVFVNAVVQVLQEDGRGMFDDYQNDATKQDFLRLGFALKAKNLPFEVFDSIVCGSVNYDADENRKLYDGLKPKVVTFGTAVEYARRANPAKLRELIKQANKQQQERQQAEYKANHELTFNLSAGQHLSGLPLANVLRESKDVAIYAGTGTGKTYFALNELPKIFFDKNILLLEPTQILSMQKANDTPEPVNIVMAGSQPNSDRVQIGTYNSITKFPDEYLKNAVLVIDEAHQLTICEGYRRRVIQTLKKLSGLCYRRIYLSGTPLPYGQNCTIDKTINVQSPSLPVNVRFIEIADRAKAIENAHIQGKTSLVYCFRKDICDNLTDYFRKRGFLAGRVHSESGESILHKNLIDGRMIDKALDFVFVTSYPSEGVDILDHNIGQIIVADFCPSWMLKQLLARTRKNPVQEVTILVKGDNEDDKTKPFSPQKGRANWQTYFKTAKAVTAFLNQQLARGRYDTATQKVRNALAGEMAKLVKKIDVPLPDCAESFSFEVDADYINWMIYQDYEKACRGNREYYIEELKRYGFAVESGESYYEKLIDAEKQTYAETIAENNLRKEQVFSKDLEAAAHLEDEALYSQEEDEASAKARLRILAKETGDRELALKILRQIGRSSQKFNQALHQAQVATYRKGNIKSMPIEKLLRMAKIESHLTSEQIFERVQDIFRADPQLCHKIITLQKTPRQLTSKQAFAVFEIFYDVARTSKYINGEKVNVYRVTSCDPLAKYRDAETSFEDVLTHFSGLEYKQIDERCESKTRYANGCIDLENQPLTDFMGQELSEYAQEQIQTFGKVF